MPAYVIPGMLLLLAVVIILWRLTRSIPSLWLLRFHYRNWVTGRGHLPKKGPMLLVCSEGQYLDFLPLVLASRRRIRFFLLDGWTTHSSEQQLLKSLGAITLHADSSSRDEVLAIQELCQALDQGEAVCIFTGVKEARSGLSLSFSQLYQKIQRQCSTPVIPVVLEYPAGSPWQHLHGQFERMPGRWWRSEVWIAFGKPLSAETSAGEVVQALHHLSAATAKERIHSQLPPHRVFVRQAARHPFRKCIVDGMTKRTLSYGKTLAGAMCLANFLRQPLNDSKMVGVWLPPGPGAALSNIALTILGKTAVNLNYTASEEGINSAINQCDLRIILTAKRFTEKVPLNVSEEIELIYLDEVLTKISNVSRLLAFLKVLLLPGWLLDRWILRLGKHSLDDLMTVIFSSGTTGDPKGVMLTHGNVRANTLSLVSTTGANASDCVLGVLPTFHSFGYTVTVWVVLQIGASVVFFPDPRQARDIGKLSKKHQCTIFLNTATFLRFCLKKCQPDEFERIRYLFCGAEKLPTSLADDFEQKFNVRPLEGYGCTELAPVTSVNLTNQTVEGVTQVRNFLGGIGRPLHGISARIIDPDSHQALPIGEEGLLVIRGANVMKGYLHREDLTSKAMIDGDYITGDMAKLDEEGCLTITGRLSRFAKIGGEMVPLEFIEEHLHLAKETSERILAVTTVPDERKGERIVVLYVREVHIEVSVLCQKLTESRLPNLWIPAERDFYEVENLPILGTGKLDLKQLKELALRTAE